MGRWVWDAWVQDRRQGVVVGLRRAELVAKRADLTLKRVDLAVSAKDHADPSYATSRGKRFDAPLRRTCVKPTASDSQSRPRGGTATGSPIAPQCRGVRTGYHGESRECTYIVTQGVRTCSKRSLMLPGAAHHPTRRSIRLHRELSARR